MLSFDLGVRKQLVDTLVLILPDLPIRAGSVSYEARDILQRVENILPNIGAQGRRLALEAKASLVSMIDDYPITDFVFEHIERLIVNSSNISTNSVKLSELLPSLSAIDLAEDIVAALESLPLRYIFSVPLGQRLSGLVPLTRDLHQLTSTVRLTRVTEEFWQNFPNTGRHNLSRLGELYLQGTRRRFEEGDVVLQIDGVGFADAYGTTATVTEALLIAKAFFGLGLAFGLLKPEWYSLNNDSAQEHMIFHLVDDSTYVGIRRFDQGADRFLKRINLAAELSEPSADLAQARTIELRLRQISVCLEDNKDARRLRLSARWYFDSYGSDDELTAFLQAVIVLETALGEESAASRKSTPLGELLSNRCAYLIAVDLAERDSIISTFSKIYKLRSAIVHNGKSRLSLTEKELFFTLRMYCARVIAREFQLLSASHRSYRTGLN